MPIPRKRVAGPAGAGLKVVRQLTFTVSLDDLTAAVLIAADRHGCPVDRVTRSGAVGQLDDAVRAGGEAGWAKIVQGVRGSAGDAWGEARAATEKLFVRSG